MYCKTLLSQAFIAVLFCALGFCPPDARACKSDDGDGTFKTPLLDADYPYPDIIRMPNDFHTVFTTLMNSPGINMVHSKDLANWETVSLCPTNCRQQHVSLSIPAATLSTFHCLLKSSASEHTRSQAKHN